MMTEQELSTCTPEYQHQQICSLSTESQFIQGYQDCAAEAIWYLTQVERLPEDDPLVVGLRLHLEEKQQALTISHLLNTSSGGSSTVCVIDSSRQCESFPGHSSQQSSLVSHDCCPGLHLKDRIPEDHITCADSDFVHCRCAELESENCQIYFNTDHQSRSSYVEDNKDQLDEHKIESLAEEILSLLNEAVDVEDTFVEDEGFIEQ